MTLPMSAFLAERTAPGGGCAQYWTFIILSCVLLITWAAYIFRDEESRITTRENWRKRLRPISEWQKEAVADLLKDL